MARSSVVELRGLEKSFPTPKGFVPAVRVDLSMSLRTVHPNWPAPLYLRLGVTVRGTLTARTSESRRTECASR